MSKRRDQRSKFNCRKKAECPMEGNGQVNDVVYRCGVPRQLPKKGFSQTCRRRMEEPFLKHKLSFKHKKIFQ